MNNVLSPDLLRRINAYWRAANYLSVGQIYLYDNPLLREPLTLSHVKPLVVGHWGTTQGNRILFRIESCDNSFEDIGGKGCTVSFSSDVIFNRSVS